MNYMKKQTEKHLLALSGTVGDFIRYWGFRRIHGEIWTQVFLSEQPLSGVEITERLGVSKALVSPALKQLVKHKLIVEKNDDKKTKRYLPQTDVLTVIKEILKKRELKMIANTTLAFDQLKRANVDGINHKNLDQLGEMILVAEFAIRYLVSQTHEEGLGEWKSKVQSL
jgi:DNA-binding transcriptional regulator GbsR (MarR family)